MMSLAINVERVKAVLIGNEWLECRPGSFDLDAYEFGQGDITSREEDPFHIVHGGGQSGVCATGFTFLGTDDQRYGGPLTAIQTVKYDYVGRDGNPR